MAGFEQSLFSSLEEVSRAENNLKNLIAENRQAEICGISRLFLRIRWISVAPQISLPEALKAAMDNRPELQQSNVARGDQSDRSASIFANRPSRQLIWLAAMEWSAWLVRSTAPAINPFTRSTAQLREQVNLLSQLARFAAFAGAASANVSPDLIGGYRQSIQNLFGNKFNNFRVGVQINLPLQKSHGEGAIGTFVG